jgi:hypothetical protein
MAEPLTITRNLDAISNHYRVFEEDQILTHDQLNDLAGYLDDQDRLTRVSLMGVGIVCGLRVALDGGSVTVTRGVGVTTDGDLIRLPAGLSFSHFKAYDKSAPAYPPFYPGQDVTRELPAIFELVNDSSATPLSQFAGNLDERFALLLVESYVEDEDLCSGTDCDNLGGKAIQNLKVLLIDNAGLATLRANLPGLESAGLSLPAVDAERLLIPAGTNSPGALAGLFRAAAARIHDPLVNAIEGGKSVLAELTGSDPAQWTARLVTIRNGFNGESFGLQHYYDFLKEAVETYSACRELLLFGEASVCCPDLRAFPKHLLLGGLDGSEDAAHRTVFHRSPILGRSAAEQDHARFLAAKLKALIDLFRAPVRTSVIRVTPSLCEDRSLEERAIPYYYDPAIHRSWSHVLETRGLSAHNYSYNAALFSAQGAAANPLAFQIGRFDFFRIEGHLGQNVSQVVTFLETEIRQKNLPFQVRAVALSANRDKVTVKPGFRYYDLHRFHQLLRWDVMNRLDEAKEFGNVYQNRVKDEVPADDNGATLFTIAKDQNKNIQTNATSVAGGLNAGYTEYVLNTDWQGAYAGTLTAAGRYKAGLGEVTLTHFVTPFDSLIANNYAPWLVWLDTLIADKDKKEDEKLLFANYHKQHPGLAHFAGVVRGGTFVLAYDESQIVVADFMLPYVCCEPVEEEEPAPPTRPDVQFTPDFVVNQGIGIQTSMDKRFDDRFTFFETEIGKTVDRKFENETRFFDMFTQSTNTLGTVFTGLWKGDTNVGNGGNIDDPLLDFQWRGFRLRLNKVDELRNELLRPGLDDSRRSLLELQLRDAENDVARSAAETTRFMADSKIDVKPGSDGFRLMTAISEGLTRITDKEALEQVKRDLGGTAGDRKTPQDLRGVLTSILKISGLGG